MNCRSWALEDQKWSHASAQDRNVWKVPTSTSVGAAKHTLSVSGSPGVAHQWGAALPGILPLTVSLQQWLNDLGWGMR